jgi:hypothetical protein
LHWVLWLELNKAAFQPYRSLTRWGRVLNLTGAATDWLDIYEKGIFLLEQAEQLASHFPETAQDELRKVDRGRSSRVEVGVWTMIHTDYHHLKNARLMTPCSRRNRSARNKSAIST